MGTVAFDEHGDSPPLEVERYLVDLLPGPSVDRAMGQYGIVEGLLRPLSKWLLAVIAGHVDVPGQRNTRLGQGAGLVCAQHVNRAQIVDRRQALYDHALDATAGPRRAPG